jgi:hypothetical protein
LRPPPSYFRNLREVEPIDSMLPPMGFELTAVYAVYAIDLAELGASCRAGCWL